MEERRHKNRRSRMIRNLFSYLNRRNLFRRGRRKEDAADPEGGDWFDREENQAD